MNTQTRLPERSQHIRKAAVRLFKSRGFAASTMRDLAEEVGIEAASLYNHIRSKQGLLHDICFRMSQRYLNDLDLNSNASKTSDLRFMLSRHLDIVLQFTDEAAVAESEWRHLDEPARSDFRNNRRRYEQVLLARIESAMKHQQIRPMDSTVVLYMVLASIQWIQRWYSESRNVDNETLKKNILTMIFHGLETSRHG